MGEPPEAQAPQLGGHRIVADHDRSAVQGGLDRWVPESLPRGREHDEVRCGVDVAPGADRCVDDGARGGGQLAGQGGSVAVLGGSQQPVGAAQCLGDPDGPADRLSPDGPHRMGHEERVVVEAQASPRPCPVAGRRVGVEAVVDGCRLDAPVRHLPSGEVVDGDVQPGGVVGRQLGDVLEPLPLPRRIVVVQDRRPATEHPCDRAGRRQVEGDGAEVLDDHQVGVGEGAGQRRHVGRHRVVYAQAGHEVRRIAGLPSRLEGSGDPGHVESQPTQHDGPVP